jgi:hypothetical protein
MAAKKKADDEHDPEVELDQSQENFKLYIDSTGSMYEAYTDLLKKLVEAKRDGTYTRTRAEALFMKHLRAAMAKYKREFGEDWDAEDSEAQRRHRQPRLGALARVYAQGFESEYDNGEMAWLGGPGNGGKTSNPQAHRGQRPELEVVSIADIEPGMVIHDLDYMYESDEDGRISNKMVPIKKLWGSGSQPPKRFVVKFWDYDEGETRIQGMRDDGRIMRDGFAENVHSYPEILTVERGVRWEPYTHDGPYGPPLSNADLDPRARWDEDTGFATSASSPSRGRSQNPDEMVAHRLANGRSR